MKHVVVALALLAVPGVAHAESTSTKCLPASLKARLAEVRSKFGPIKVISTHRPGAKIRKTGHTSLHASCRAVDFIPPRGKYQAVANYLKRANGGYTLTYSIGHIHIDTGRSQQRSHLANG
jgi:uncharacterized protein YcbK (DUF882 family)